MITSNFAVSSTSVRHQSASTIRRVAVIIILVQQKKGAFIGLLTMIGCTGSWHRRASFNEHRAARSLKPSDWEHSVNGIAWIVPVCDTMSVTNRTPVTRVITRQSAYGVAVAAAKSSAEPSVNEHCCRCEAVDVGNEIGITRATWISHSSSPLGLLSLFYGRSPAH